MSKQEEKGIENSVLDYVTSFKFCEAEKVNNGAVYDPTRKAFRTPRGRHLKPGVSDISGVIKRRCLKIEVKTPKELRYLLKHYEEIKSGKYTKNIKKKDHLREQILYIESYWMQGAVAFFADSIDRVKKELEKEGISL